MPPSGGVFDCAVGRAADPDRDVPPGPDDDARVWAEIWHEALQAGFAATRTGEETPEQR